MYKRQVRRTGQVSFKGLNVFVSGGLYGERVAIRPTAEDGVYDVVFIRKTLRQIDLRQRATSVSYTHLDVYKRQGLGRAAFGEGKWQSAVFSALSPNPSPINGRGERSVYHLK